MPKSNPPPEGHTRLTLNLPIETHRALKETAAASGITIRELVEEAILERIAWQCPIDKGMKGITVDEAGQ